MCGRTACTLAPEDVGKACQYQSKGGERKQPQWRDGDSDKYKPSYNKCPQSNSPVLLSLKHFQKDADSSERVLAAMRWGLIPSWFTETDPSKMQFNTSNCRSDTMAEKPLYKGPLFKGKRCVILADGFFEWRRQDGEKQPYYIYFPSVKAEQSSDEKDSIAGKRLLTMAGLFDCWQPPNGGEPLYSYTVITVDASKAMNWIHDRMPAILDGDEEIQNWLDFGEIHAKEALKLLHPIENITYHPVSTIVNNSRNNTPECVVPIILKPKKEPALSASSKKMLAWLQSKSPIKKEEESGGLPKSPKLSQFAVSPKKTSAGLMHQWLKKEGGEPSPKRARR